MAESWRSMALVIATFLAATTPPAQAQQLYLVAKVEETPWDYRGQEGRRLSFICPASDRWFRPVWGTDVYTIDSKLCSAAIHAGRLQYGKSGLVTITVGAHGEPYVGSVRNGVTSESYDVYPMSFTFDTSSEPAPVEWQTSVYGMPGDFTGRIAVVCPEKSDLSAKVWGEDVYTLDSSICVAAVHAGVITSAGGPVQLAMAPGRDKYVGSTRHGVTSTSWGRQEQSYEFIANGQPVRGGNRTIKLAGFTAAGEAPLEEEPRVIRLDGWTASGPAKKQ